MYNNSLDQLVILSTRSTKNLRTIAGQLPQKTRTTVRHVRAGGKALRPLQRKTRG